MLGLVRTSRCRWSVSCPGQALCYSGLPLGPREGRRLEEWSLWGHRACPNGNMPIPRLHPSPHDPLIRVRQGGHTSPKPPDMLIKSGKHRSTGCLSLVKSLKILLEAPLAGASLPLAPGDPWGLSGVRQSLTLTGLRQPAALRGLGQVLGVQPRCGQRGGTKAGARAAAGVRAAPRSPRKSYSPLQGTSCKYRGGDGRQLVQRALRPTCQNLAGQVANHHFKV